MEPDPQPNVVWNNADHRLIFDAEVAEVPFTAFTSKPEQVTARLIVRRVK